MNWIPYVSIATSILAIVISIIVEIHSRKVLARINKINKESE
jgi:hypothetical protein